MNAESARNFIGVNTPKIREPIRMLHRALLAVILAVLVPVGLRAQGTIQVQAIDLADTTVGQDLWQFQYTLSGFSFQAGEGFSIFFDPQFYTDLQNAQPGLSTDWSVLAVQPDVILQQPGYFDSQALVNAPSLAVLFQVDSIWLGQGTPGPQTFTVYDVNFSTIAGGTTVTGVAEPQVLGLLSLGVVGLWAQRHRHSKNASNAKA